MNDCKKQGVVSIGVEQNKIGVEEGRRRPGSSASKGGDHWLNRRM